MPAAFQMDPSTKIGKIKEQVAHEQQARRNFQKHWAQLAGAESNHFYNPRRLNEIMHAQLGLSNVNCCQHDGTGDGYFVSPQMHTALLGTCRCGRPRAGVHLSKCLQKEENRYLLEAQKNAEPLQPLPRTTNGFIGWQPRQKVASGEWDRSTKYVSPVATMVGPRITATPYNVISIG